MKKATFWDFIDVALYLNPPYTLRDIDYYIYSELKDEYQKHHTNEYLTMDYLRQYFDKGLIFIDDSV